MITDFCLGAVMQQDPYLEEFGTLPDEPPDVAPCWTNDDSIADSETCRRVFNKEPQKKVKTEQPDLFAVPTDTPTVKATPKPSLSATHTNTPTTSTLPKPYVPSPIPYAQWLAIFCGDKTLAYWYYSHQCGNEPD